MAFSSTRARIYRSRSLLPTSRSPVFRPSPISSPLRASSSSSSKKPSPPPPPEETLSPLDAPRTPRPTTPLGQAHHLAKTYLPHLTALFTAIKEKDRSKIQLPTSTRPPRKDPVVSFKSALQSGRHHGIGPAYLEAVADLQEGETTPPITEEEVRAAIQLLSRSRDEHQWTIIDTMVEDLSHRYQSPPTHLDYRAILRFLANSPTPRAAFPRLETIPLDIPISIIDFNIVLGGLSRAGDEEGLRSALEQVAILDLTPDRQTFHLYLKGLFLARAQAGPPPALPSSSSSSDNDTSLSTSTSPLSSDVDSILRKMSALRLPPSSATYSILAEGYRRLGDGTNTERALDLVRSALSEEMSIVKISSDGTDVLSVVPWNALVAAASIEKTLKDGVDVVEKMKEAGVEPDEGTIDALLRGISVRKMSEVLDIAQLLESKTNVELFARHWGELILKVLHPDGGPSTKSSQEEALRVYNEATMKRGILVDAEMALPLLEAFCFPGPGEEPNVDRSMEIYSDLLRAETLQQVNAVTESETLKPASSHSSSEPHSSSSLDIAASEDELPPLGPTVDVYDLLLNGIAASSNEKADHPKAWKLLQDMKIRGLHFSNPTVVGHIKRFMARASSHKEAFAMYNHFIELHPQSITADEDAFLGIVRQFIFSEWWKSETPPAILVGNFINDARRSGFEPSHRVMTTLFSQYARVAYKDGMSLEEQETFDKIQPVVLSHVKTALAWCRIDPYIRFDRTLYNAFMVASARVGLQKDAYGTWLIVSESDDPNVAANNESVNIIFDSIRLHADSFQAVYIFRWLRNGEFPLDLENWHSYLRCLLGCGDPDRAMDVAFTEMNQRTGFPAAPAPTWDTIRMIMHYQDAYGTAFKLRIRKRIAREYPEWWEAGLKDETNLEEEKLVRMRDECNVGRGMVDLLPEPPENDEGEEWGRRERERAEEKAAKERYRVKVMKASTPQRPVLVHY